MSEAAKVNRLATIRKQVRQAVTFSSNDVSFLIVSFVLYCKNIFFKQKSVRKNTNADILLSVFLC